MADVNGDGRLDIAASCRLGARVRIYLNAGGGTFTLGETPLVINPLTVKLADIGRRRGQGPRWSCAGTPARVAVFANDGAGHFARQPRHRRRGRTPGPWTSPTGTATATSTWRRVDRIRPSPPRSLNTRVGCPASATLAVTGGSVAEGNAGSSSLSFGVSLSTPVSWPVTVEYATADGTATAGSDYEAAAGTLTFAPGETQKAVAVPVFGDAAIEADETFYLDLSAADGAPIETAQATGHHPERRRRTAPARSMSRASRSEPVRSSSPGWSPARWTAA